MQIFKKIIRHLRLSLFTFPDTRILDGKTAEKRLLVHNVAVRFSPLFADEKGIFVAMRPFMMYHTVHEALRLWRARFSQGSTCEGRFYLAQRLAR